jgi:soluble lytic murein transglycosylase
LKRRKRIETLICFLLLLSSLLYLIHTIDQLSAKRRESAVLPLVSAASAEFDVPVAMILAVIRTESNFQSKAISRAGAVGLMQLMPDTFAWLCEDLAEPHAPSAITDPQTNIRFGTYYLSALFEKFGSWRVALAAYNAGEGRVAEWLKDPTLSPDGTLHRIPYPETAAYVKKTLSYYATYLIDHPVKEKKT